MRIIQAVALVAAMLLPTSLYAQAYGNLSQKKAIKNFSNQELVRVLALPVTDFNVDFYYRIEEYNQRLTERDHERISNLVAKEVNRGTQEAQNLFVQLMQALTLELEKKQEDTDENIITTPTPTPTPPTTIPDNTNAGSEINIPNEIADLLSNNCIVCHDNNEKSKFDFNNYTKFEQSIGTWIPMNRIDAWLIFDSVHTGYMPKNGAPLNQSDTDILQQWARNNSKH